MSHLYLYSNGQFVESDTKLHNLIDDWETFDEFLEKNGFWKSSCLSAGHYPYFGYKIYAHSHDKLWFCDLTISEDINHILISDLKSLLMFVKEYNDLFNNYYKCKFFKTDDGDYLNIDHIELISFEDKKEKKVRVLAQTKEKEYWLDRDIRRNIFLEFHARELGLNE